MNKLKYTISIICLILLSEACSNQSRSTNADPDSIQKEKLTASDILQKTINTIDTIETIYYKQDMLRSDPQNINDTIFRYREMYFKRLTSDSIVGVKGHWYMYLDDKKQVAYEDIYDGERLIRKNNRLCVARVYDLVKYPEFRKVHFWSHNTLFGMQFEYKYILGNLDSFVIKKLNDTIIDNKSCYQIAVFLENKTYMPGFEIKLENQEGLISTTSYFIDKERYCPLGMKSMFYTSDNPNQKSFIDQKYYDIKYNLSIDEHSQFNASEKSIQGYERKEMQAK